MTEPATQIRSVAEHLAYVISSTPVLGTQTVGLSDALGRVTVQDIDAPLDLPPFTAAAMDGFAILAADTASATYELPATLDVTGEVAMGRPAPGRVDRGEAVAVPTGGQVPEGATAVVQIERCRVEGSLIHIDAPVAEGANLRPKGKDLAAGETLIPSGSNLTAAQLAALAAAGIDRVEVEPRLRVGVLSTGDELADPGNPLPAAGIFDSNSYMLAALVRTVGAEVVSLGRVPDDPSALLAALQAGAPQVDVFVCSGGVSAGENDPLRRAFARSPEICFAAVAMQPGRPQAFGSFSGKPLFGLPGNPIAALVSFKVFVEPALDRMSGGSGEIAYGIAYLEGPVTCHAHKVRFVPGILDGSTVASLAPGPNLLGRLGEGGCLIEVPPGCDLDRGSECRAISLG